jgi:hypothetical protein
MTDPGCASGAHESWGEFEVQLDATSIAAGMAAVAVASEVLGERLEERFGDGRR